MPPPSSGGVLLVEMLNVLEGLAEHLSIMREAAGPQMDILLDLNFNAKTEGYLKILRAIEHLDMFWVEIDTFNPQALAAAQSLALLFFELASHSDEGLSLVGKHPHIVASWEITGEGTASVFNFRWEEFNTSPATRRPDTEFGQILLDRVARMLRPVVDLARRAEDAGWDGFFVWDHILVDPAWTMDIADPWIALAGIAQAAVSTPTASCCTFRPDPFCSVQLLPHRLKPTLSPFRAPWLPALLTLALTSGLAGQTAPAEGLYLTGVSYGTR